jgi:hypothetical protein
MGRTKRTFSEVFEKLKERAQEIGMNIRVEKQAMVQTVGTRRIRKILTIKDHDSEAVGRFKYLRTVINNTNN